MQLEARYLTLRSQVHKKIIISLFSEPTNFFSRQPEKSSPSSSKIEQTLRGSNCLSYQWIFLSGCTTCWFSSFSLSHSLSHWIYHTLSLSDTLTRSLIFSFEIQLEQFPLWKGEAFFPTSDFFPFASFFFSAQQKISLQSTVDAVDGRRSFAEWQQTEQTREKKNYCPCQIPILSICDDWAQLSALPPS